MCCRFASLSKRDFLFKIVQSNGRQPSLDAFDDQLMFTQVLLSAEKGFSPMSIFSRGKASWR